MKLYGSSGKIGAVWIGEEGGPGAEMFWEGLDR